MRYIIVRYYSMNGIVGPFENNMEKSVYNRASWD